VAYNPLPRSPVYSDNPNHLLSCLPNLDLHSRNLQTKDLHRDVFLRCDRILWSTAVVYPALTVNFRETLRVYRRAAGGYSGSGADSRITPAVRRGTGQAGVSSPYQEGFHEFLPVTLFVTLQRR